METLGYVGQKVFFNSMFAPPTPQSRDRLYVVWHRKGNTVPDLDLRPLAFCTKCCRGVDAAQTFKRGGSPKARYQRQYTYTCPTCRVEVKPYYYAALNAIDWSLRAERIMDRKKELKPRTLARIEHGLKKYGRQPLLITTNMTSDGGRSRPTLAPGFTQTGSNLTALLSPSFLMHMQGEAGFRVSALADPLSTQVAGTVSAGGVHHGLIYGAAIVNLRDWTKANQLVSSLCDVVPTQVAAGPQTGILQRAPFLISYYGNEQTAGATDPIDTVTTVDRHGVVEAGDELRVEDCYFRMLQPHEIGRAMAFPDSYVVIGNSRDKVKQYGNAVTPPVMEWLIRRCIESLHPELAIFDPWAAFRRAA